MCQAARLPRLPLLAQAGGLQVVAGTPAILGRNLGGRAGGRGARSLAVRSSRDSFSRRYQGPVTTRTSPQLTSCSQLMGTMRPPLLAA